MFPASARFGDRVLSAPDRSSPPGAAGPIGSAGCSMRSFLRLRSAGLLLVLAAALPCRPPLLPDALQVIRADDGDEELPPPPRDNLTLPAGVAPEVKAEFDAAVELFQKARAKFVDESLRKDAMRAMTRLKSKIPSGQAHYYIGILHQWEDDTKKARKVLEELLALHPEFYEAHVELGDVEVQEKKPEAAISHYQRALEIYPYFEYGVDRMLVVLVQLGRFEEAKPFLERALLRGESELREKCGEAIRFELDGPPWETTYTQESENYIVKTDHSQEFALRISETAELIRDLYDVIFPEIEKPDRKYLVIVYKDRDGYMAGGAPANTGGYYTPLSRRLMLFRSPDEEQTMQTLKHEGFHQYCHDYLDNIPQWFNEGLGDYFAASELVMLGKKRGMRIRPSKGRLNNLMLVFRAGIDIPSIPVLMNMSREEMYDVANDGDMAAIHYAQAWSVVYFCIDGGNEAHRNALKNYFKALRQGKSSRAAYESTFGRFDMRQFEEEWRRFMQKKAQEDPGI
jgi:tetratricopeptide (TPR) repeat protein